MQTLQLERAGISDHFERRFSVDAVQRQKPAPEVYAYVQRQLGAAASQLIMVACHTWDTLGAVAAGWDAGLVRRPGNDLLAVGPQPTLVAGDLGDIANQLIERFS